MSKVKRTGKIKKIKKTKKSKSKGIDGYYIANGKIKVLKKDWVFGI
tara:strand:- start:266 stop:403 length:138 start_codon:yes stop_codon:yes gene_type:complete